MTDESNDKNVLDSDLTEIQEFDKAKERIARLKRIALAFGVLALIAKGAYVIIYLKDKYAFGEMIGEVMIAVPAMSALLATLPALIPSKGKPYKTRYTLMFLNVVILWFAILILSSLIEFFLA